MSATAIDELLGSARAHEADFRGMRAVVPARHVAIVTCMDSRIDNFAIFGLDDVLRFLVVSQRVLQTREVVLVHHTDCGLHNADEDAMRAQIRRETGAEPDYAFGAFPDLDEAVRRALARVREHPFLPHRDRVRGFVYDVHNGHLREISGQPSATSAAASPR